MIFDFHVIGSNRFHGIDKKNKAILKGQLSLDHFKYSEKISEKLTLQDYDPNITGLRNYQ